MEEQSLLQGSERIEILYQVLSPCEQAIEGRLIEMGQWEV